MEIRWRFLWLLRENSRGNYFQTKQTVHMNMSVGEAFERAMMTVARFVEENMDPAKSQVFFRSYAPVHFRGGTWDHGGHCNADEKPLQKFPFVWEDRTPSTMISKVMATNVKNPVNFLNITYLSDLRPDGHSSMYQRVPPSPMNHQDCSHWCLPGVPDTWNEILFATLLKNGQGRWGYHTVE
ncbi:unnamed protein product [Calypogeia fissa]